MFLMRGLASSRVREEDRWTSDNHVIFFYLPGFVEYLQFVDRLQFITVSQVQPGNMSTRFFIEYTKHICKWEINTKEYR